MEQCGWSAGLLGDPDDHPVHLCLFSEASSLNARIYIWNLTHGGGHRALEEYRIQVTGVERFEGRTGFKTLVLGYWADGEVFAGFDLRRHRGHLGHSPSIQIREEALRSAYRNGFAPHDKGGGEIAIAFRPDYFVDYCRNLDRMHSLGVAAEGTAALEAVAEDGVQLNESAVDLIPTERRAVLRQVAAGHLCVQFRNRVLAAYQHQCAFCDVQLRLVEAAHIVPSSHPVASYETSNGVALCALHHKSFDVGLVAFDTSYRVMVNSLALDRLRLERLDGGAERFVNGLRQMLRLPPSAADRPSIPLVEEGLRIRNWPL